MWERIKVQRRTNGTTQQRCNNIAVILLMLLLDFLWGIIDVNLTTEQQQHSIKYVWVIGIQHSHSQFFKVILTPFIVIISSLQSLSHVQLIVTHELQHTRSPWPSLCPFPFPPALNPSQHQSLFQWVNSSHEVAKVLKFQPQHQSFQWTPRMDLL